MRIKMIPLLAFATSIFFVSCKKELMPQDNSAATQTETPVAETPVAAPKPTAAPDNAIAALPAAAINPAHGQPGHRCDIAVGAPLNAPAANKTQAAVQMAPAALKNSVSIPAQKPVVTAPGMNPPHGQPNHRCDIAVGAPLNSAPTKPAGSSTITTSNTAPAILSTPATTSPLPVANTAVTPGMNPPHGQEGHRCDVAVGAALPKE